MRTAPHRRRNTHDVPMAQDGTTATTTKSNESLHPPRAPRTRSGRAHRRHRMSPPGGSDEHQITTNRIRRETSPRHDTPAILQGPQFACRAIAVHAHAAVPLQRSAGQQPIESLPLCVAAQSTAGQQPKPLPLMLSQCTAISSPMPRMSIATRQRRKSHCRVDFATAHRAQ